MTNILEITIQRRAYGVWPVLVEYHRVGSLLPVRSEAWVELVEEPMPFQSQSMEPSWGRPYSVTRSGTPLFELEPIARVECGFWSMSRTRNCRSGGGSRYRRCRKASICGWDMTAGRKKRSGSR